MACEACGNDYTDDGWCVHCGWPPKGERDQGLDEVPDPVAPRARTLVEEAPFESSEDTYGSEPDVARALRSLDNEPEQHLADAGYHASNVGISVTKVTAWKRKRSAVADTRLYDYLVRDAVECNLLFWQAYRWYEQTDAFLEAVLEDGDHGESEENVARTYRWITEEIDAPTTLNDRQAAITEW